MKRKHKRELRMLRAEVDHSRSEYLELLERHETLCRSVGALKQAHEHLTEALSQRGVWDHDVKARYASTTGGIPGRQ